MTEWEQQEPQGGKNFWLLPHSHGVFKRYKQDESREAEGSGVIGYGGRGGGRGEGVGGVGRNRNEEVESPCFHISSPPPSG